MKVLPAGGCITGLNFTELILEDSVEIISVYAFSGYSNLKGKVIIPSSVKEIKSRIFEHCTALTSIVIKNSSDNVTIDPAAFEDCSATVKYEPE